MSRVKDIIIGVLALAILYFILFPRTRTEIVYERDEKALQRIQVLTDQMKEKDREIDSLKAIPPRIDTLYIRIKSKQPKDEATIDRSNNADSLDAVIRAGLHR